MKRLIKKDCISKANEGYALSVIVTLIAALIVLMMSLSGCTTQYPTQVGHIKTNDIPTLRAFQRECLKASYRFVRIERVVMFGQPDQWHMTCYENPDFDVLEGFDQ